MISEHSSSVLVRFSDFRNMLKANPTNLRPAAAIASDWASVDGAEPLSAAEEVEAERIARRLASEIRPVIGLLPDEERGASAMARALELDRATCQRLVAAARQNAGVETLVQMPGVQGLRQFLAAMDRRITDEAGREILTSAGAAIDAFSDLLDRLAGSQRKLKARLEARRAATEGPAIHVRGGSDDLSVRQSLFKAAATATGRWSETLVSLNAIRPLPGNPLMTESVGVRGLIGHHARQDAVPLELGHVSPLRARAAGEQVEPAGLVLEEFSSKPSPIVVSKSSPTVVVYTVDLPAMTMSGGVDVVIGKKRSLTEKHPATLDPPIGEVWNLINFPARRMLFDVYLHRDIARRCLPSIELHLWAPESPSHVQARWSTRFPGSPRLELLGPGLRAIATPTYARLPEVVARMFSLAGWEPEEFVGYRCEKAYPMWRGGYCMSFDFSGTETLERES